PVRGASVRLAFGAAQQAAVGSFDLELGLGVAVVVRARGGLVQRVGAPFAAVQARHMAGGNRAAQGLQMLPFLPALCIVTPRAGPYRSRLRRPVQCKGRT